MSNVIENIKKDGPNVFTLFLLGGKELEGTAKATLD